MTSNVNRLNTVAVTVIFSSQKRAGELDKDGEELLDLFKQVLD